MRNNSKAPATNPLVNFFSDRRRALAAAGVWHLALTLLVFGLGKSQVYSQQFDANGVGKFALDGYFYRVQANALADTLLHNGVSAWLADPAQFHVKLYSLSFALFRPLFGANILAAEPLNLLYYLAIVALTFTIAKKIAGERAAVLSSAIVAIWPSLLLHTTQLLRDPMFVAVLLALILVLVNLLTNVYDWIGGLIVGVLGVTVSFFLWLTRSDMWLVFRVIMFFALGLLAIRMLRERKLLLWNLAGIALLTIVTTFVPERKVTPPPEGVGIPVSAPVARQSFLWDRIAYHRHIFILSSYRQSGSTIDTDVEFSSFTDIVKYIPRALAIGYLAPFPEMWFRAGYNVGLIGRLLSGIETSLTYVIELLACVFVWHNRRSLRVWLMVFTATTGVVALGIVVVNLGTLYRMRYAFWVLVTILGVAGLVKMLSMRIRNNDSVSNRKAARSSERRSTVC